MKSNRVWALLLPAGAIEFEGFRGVVPPGIQSLLQPSRTAHSPGFRRQATETLSAEPVTVGHGGLRGCHDRLARLLKQASLKWRHCFTSYLRERGIADWCSRGAHCNHRSSARCTGFSSARPVCNPSKFSPELADQDDRSCDPGSRMGYR
jgi:hypothetical protein